MYSLFGSVTNVDGIPLPYASISLNETRYGTLTDESGDFKLSVPAGKYEITIGYLGYKTLTENLDMTGGHSVLIFKLIPEELFIEEVLITQDGRDPAYSIIRLAIDNKKKNRRPFSSYEHKAYTKTVIGFPDDFDMDSMIRASPLGAAAGSSGSDESLTEGLPEMESNILYLSENLSQVFVREPNKIKEEIVSSRVSGDSRQFSFVGSLSNRFSPYENKTVLEGVVDRGIISPIADNAFFFYEYKLLGTLKEKGSQSYKIRVNPKRPHDAVYRGIIYIADSSYAVKELDLFITEEQQIDLLDTLSIKQEYMRFQNAWMPFQTQMGLSFKFNILGFSFPFTGGILSLLSGYEVEKEISKKIFGAELVKVADTALGHTRLYWDTIRPIPLTRYEASDYQLKDSLEEVRLSPEYLDSLSKRTRKVNFSNFLLGGHTFQNFRKKSSLTLLAPLAGTSYNPMEGWNFEWGIRYKKEFKKKHVWQIEPIARYGFANSKLSYRLTTFYKGNPKRNEKLTFQGGDYISQFSRFEQISPGVNFMYILFKENYLKLYQKQFGELSYESELIAGMSFNLNIRHEKRREWINRGDWSLFNKDAEDYLPNIPLSSHNASIGEFTLRYQPFVKFIQTPEGKLSVGNSWPALSATLIHAQPLLGDSAADFTKISIGISDVTRLGMLGQTQWRVTAGKFLSKNTVYFPDQFHFKGNETFLSTGTYDEFFLAPYYATSTTKPFVEAHMEHAFGGFLFNKIPGLRKLKLKEFVGAHYLIREDGKPYLEINAGLEAKVLKFLPLRFDVNVSVLGDLGGRKVYFKWVVPLESLGQLSLGG